MRWAAFGEQRNPYWSGKCVDARERNNSMLAGARVRCVHGHRSNLIASRDHAGHNVDWGYTGVVTAVANKDSKQTTN